ncbi:MAG: triose-phosphate isomerase [Candidatus Magasanikbacteria bacterium]
MKYIFANWKMYLDFDESNILMNRLLQNDFDGDSLTMAIFPTTLAFTEIEKATQDTLWNVGAQNVAWVEKGAYTGAISAHMFASAGAKYALVGHSERRYVFGEKDEDVRKKVEACLEVGITPVICVGETKEDYADDKRQYRIKKQLLAVFDGLETKGKEIVIAYEPVWAIGTGDAATPADAEDVIGWIKSELEAFTKQEIPVLYGGSVDKKNVVSYIEQDSIDGVLVGHVSTQYDEFVDLIREIEKQ